MQSAVCRLRVDSLGIYRKMEDGSWSVVLSAVAFRRRQGFGGQVAKAEALAYADCILPSCL